MAPKKKGAVSIIHSKGLFIWAFETDCNENSNPSNFISNNVATTGNAKPKANPKMA